MPASLFGEMDQHYGNSAVGVGLEDQRAIQLALELSMLGLTSDPQPISHDSVNNSDSHFFTSPGDEISRILPKKSQNMTECVPVPSSEHVAEIVGRQ
ncbi:unnamed protein product, partial [Allacma fusca]